MKILNLASKSVKAANTLPYTLQVIFEGLFGSDSTFKLKSATMSYLQWVFRMSDASTMNLMGPVLLSAVWSLLSPQGPT